MFLFGISYHPTDILSQTVFYIYKSGYAYFAIFIASLIIGPAFSTMVARFLLSIKNTKDLKHIFIGNLWVFGAMWLVLRLLPM